MNILIAGDFFISDNFRNKNLIDNTVLDLFEKADYRIINQEAPITPDIPGNKILKTGPHLRTSKKTTIPFLKQLKIDMATLANNHILDYGPKGLRDTFNTLRKNKIDFVGAGNNLSESTKPFTIEREGLKIAVLNFAENEWSIAGEDNSGANPLDIIDNVTQIKAAKTTHDKVICIIHGGHEYYHLPSPRMVKQYRFYAENGVDAIVGHHTHCIGGYEIYNNVPIFYSLGNFLFTLPSSHKSWYSGFIMNFVISKDKPIEFELFPIEQNNNTFMVKLLKGEKENRIRKEILKYNSIISDNQLIQQNWKSFINKNSKQYLKSISSVLFFNNRYLRAGLNSLHVNKLFLGEDYLKLILNLMRCESHLGAIKEIVEERLKKY